MNGFIVAFMTQFLMVGMMLSAFAHLIAGVFQ